MNIFHIKYFIKGYKAICIFPIGIFYKGEKLTNKEMNHEMIHWYQQVEMIGIFFYLWYFFEWFIRLFINKGNAYKNISFEKEAFDNSGHIDYLMHRKKYAWFNYLKK